MKSLACFSLLVASITQVSAHYQFTSLIANGVNTGPFVHVRPSTNSNTPILNVTSPDITCNEGGRTAGATTTATVAAGSTIGFVLDKAIYHLGVLNVYMAKAPTTAAAFDGSGDVWFKVFQITAESTGKYTPLRFPTDNLEQVTFPIPSAVPAGEYLVRVEHIALHTAGFYGGAQFYISCAQVNVTGEGTGTPDPLVAFPGYYTGFEPGILINLFNAADVYVQPGPAVWTG